MTSHDLTESQWYASEGGRKCVVCHCYRRADDLHVPAGSSSCHHIGDGLIVCYAEAPICGACLAKRMAASEEVVCE